MGHALINLKGEELIGETIEEYNTQDAIRVWGSNNLVSGCTIKDLTGNFKAHRDLIQPIPLGTEPNAQMHGAVSDNNCFENNTLISDGAGQCLFSSDGCERGAIISNNIMSTKGEHTISLCMLSAEIYDNMDSRGKRAKPCKVVNNPLRIGGGHPQSFYVSSFLPSSGYEYKEINTNQPIIDLRFDRNKPGATYVDDFDIIRWREICERIHYPHNGFDIHFRACIQEYLHGEIGIEPEYTSPTMWIKNNHLYVPDRTKLNNYDLEYWAKRWPNFSPYEVDSRDFSIILYIPAFDGLQKLRIEDGRPRKINSAWRTPNHNAAIGGKKNSDHTFVNGREINGSGFDLSIIGSSEGRKLESLAVKLGFNAIGRYRKSKFIHISMRKPKPSGKLYIWGRW